MKKIIILILFLLLFVTVGCNQPNKQQLEAPTDFKIENEIILFTPIENATHTAIIKNKETNIILNKTVENGTTIDSLELEPGDYSICIEVVLDDNKVQTFTIDFTVEDEQQGTNDFLEAPTDFKIVNDTIVYTPVLDATHKLVIKNKETNVVTYKDDITTGTTIASLGLEPGDYSLYIEVSLGTQKDNTKMVNISIDDPNAVCVLSESNIMNSQYVKLIGRTYYDDNLDAVMMPQSASGFTIKFKGSFLTADLVATNTDIAAKKPYIAIIIDGDYSNPIVKSLDSNEINDLVLVSNLSKTEHEVTVIKRNESVESFFGLKKIATDGKLLPKVEKERYIEVLGDSTIAGYGIEVPNGVVKTSENTNIMKTFTYLAALNFDADYSIICNSGWGLTGSKWTNPQTVNLFEVYKRFYGTLNVSNNKHIYSEEYFDFTTARKADVVILSVGANDLTYISEGFNISTTEGNKRREEFTEKYIELLNFINEQYGEDVDIFMISWTETGMDSTIKKVLDKANKTMDNVYMVAVKGDRKASSSHPSVESHAECAQILIAEIKKVKGWN